MTEPTFGFTLVPDGLGRFHPKWGEQSVKVRTCRHGLCANIALKSGGRWVTFSLTAEEAEHLAGLLVELINRQPPAAGEAG